MLTIDLFPFLLASVPQKPYDVVYFPVRYIFFSTVQNTRLFSEVHFTCVAQYIFLLHQCKSTLHHTINRQNFLANGQIFFDYCMSSSVLIRTYDTIMSVNINENNPGLLVFVGIKRGNKILHGLVTRCLKFLMSLEIKNFPHKIPLYLLSVIILPRVLS